MVDQDPDEQMLMKVTNQVVVMVMRGELENQNLLNELVLEKIIFALAIENMTIETMTINHHPKPIFIWEEEEQGNETHSKARTVARNIDECRWGNVFFHNWKIFAQTQIFVGMCIRTTSTMMVNDSVRLHIVRRSSCLDRILHSTDSRKRTNERKGISRDQQLIFDRRRFDSTKYSEEKISINF